MSNEAMTWAIKCKVARSHKLVLMLLADAHNGHSGECFPTQSWIMEHGGLSESTVLNCLKDLEEWGFVDRDTVRLGQGKGSRTRYTLHLRNLEPQNLELQNLRFGTPKNNSLEPPKTGGDLVTGRNRKEPESISLLFEEVWKIWNSTTHKVNQTKSQARKAFSTACKNHDPQDIKRAVQFIIDRKQDHVSRRDKGQLKRDEFEAKLPDFYRWLRDERFNDELDLMQEAEDARQQDFGFADNDNPESLMASRIRVYWQRPEGKRVWSRDWGAPPPDVLADLRVHALYPEDWKGAA